MARRTNLRLVPTTTYVSRHPAGALGLRPEREAERISELEGALVRVAGLCSDRPAVMEIISRILFEDRDDPGNWPPR